MFYSQAGFKLSANIFQSTVVLEVTKYSFAGGHQGLTWITPGFGMDQLGS